MKKNILFYVLFFSFSGLPVSAQNLHIKESPLPCLNKKFTVVAHIVRDSLGELNISEEEILQSIDSLNRYFSPICASFEVCEFRIIDNFRYDDLGGPAKWEELKTKYHQKKRLNIFFINSLLWLPFDCGYSDIGGIGSSLEGAVAIEKGCIYPLSKAIPHEMGHFFGLLNTNHNPGEELVNGDNCQEAGDEICDTPADPFVAGDSIIKYLSLEFTCRFIFPETDPNGQYYVPDVGNIMSYYPDTCRCGFTNEQYRRMAEAYLEAPEKVW